MKRSGRAPKTKKTYQGAVRRILKTGFALRPVRTIRYAQLEDFRDDQLELGLSPRTVALDLSVVRMAWNWGCTEGRHYVSAPLRFPRVKIRGYIQNHYTPTVAEILATYAAMATFRRTWPSLAYLLMYATGARISEISRLEWADLDIDARVIHLGRHEGGQKTGEREAPIGDDVWPILRDLERGKPGGERILPVKPESVEQGLMRYYIGRATKEAEATYHTPHGLRRAAIDALCRRVPDLTAVASIVGNSLKQIEKAYREVNREDRSAAVRQAGLGALPEGVIPFPKSAPRKAAPAHRPHNVKKKTSNFNGYRCKDK